MSYLNSYFDKIYCINLERRPDRRIKAENHFKSLGIEVDFFNAIDGNSLSNIPRGLNKGEIGCILSHIEIYKDSINKGIGNYLILEDDCEFDLDIDLKFKEYEKQIPNDWNLLYLGGNHNGISLNKVSENVHKLHKTYTTHCYGVRSGFSEILLKEINPNKIDIKQVDVELFDIQNKYQCYGITPHIAWQYDGFSDIVGEYRDYNFLKTDGTPR